MALHLLSLKGFRAAGVAAGIKVSKKNDVGLLIGERPMAAAAAFTTNKVFAAPVTVGRENVADGTLRGVVVNSGNANACTGKQGERDARAMCALTAQLAGGAAKDYLPSSTGIIGHHLPMDLVTAGINTAFQALGHSEEHATSFTDAVLTTDTRRKFASATFKLGKDRVTITGICKGAGMIGPRLSVNGAKPRAVKQATMLAYLLTDAQIAAPRLKKLLQTASESSFNCVTIDDHMSTNDTAVLLASGASGAKVATDADSVSFAKALADVTQALARQIAADGEGATKIVTIKISRAASAADARLIARAIANSPLVKCAFNGNDPNWGRIVSAAGMCGATFDPSRATLKLQGTVVFRAGTPVAFDAELVSKSLAVPEVTVDLTCGGGDARAVVWTCDFSKEYVSINADYHT